MLLTIAYLESAALDAFEDYYGIRALADYDFQKAEAISFYWS